MLRNAVGFLLSAIFVSALAVAQQDSTSDTFLKIETLRLWEGRAPGAIADTPDDVPFVSVLQPWDAKPNHPAVIVAPGGSYKFLASVHEGREVADWFAARGFTAFVLRYRLGPRYLYPIPLQDAQRAVRLVRARAEDFGIDPNRIGMVGFSAGGHLTAMAGTTADDGDPGAADATNRVSSRLNFMVLAYPWLNAMDPPQPNWLSYCGEQSLPAEKCKIFEQYSPLRGVSPKTPPTFLFHTADDDAVPARASMAFFQALQSAKVPSELHIYAHGPHGVGFAEKDPVLGTWPLLLEQWLRSQKIIQ
jgi:acetyl esterase/lipase